MAASNEASSSWDPHARIGVNGGAQTCAIFGQDGAKWGGAAASGVSPTKGVGAITNFSGLVAALEAGTMPVNLTADGLAYMPVSCERRTLLVGRSRTGKTLCMGPSNQSVIVCTGTDAGSTRIGFSKMIDYMKSMNF